MIYTKTGDKGDTSLVGGARVRKNDIRVEAYGTVDELNAQISLLGEYIKPISVAIYEDLKYVQRVLFDIQTLLATEDEVLCSRFPQIGVAQVGYIERKIDEMTSLLPPLESFVLPGGSVASAQGHVARCVCRRAERRSVSLSECAVVSDGVLIFINRLSDYLFMLSRRVLQLEKIEEHCVKVGQ